jgi:LmbE family N-acetylglucosaminyl deacetylase
MRRRWLVAVVVVALLIVAAGVTFALRPSGGLTDAAPADPAAAKIAGERLLASRDATILVVVAHPDDAEYWAGGTLALLARHNRVVLLMGTSGDKGDAGLVPGLGAIRERLQREAGRILGYRDIVFLRNPDGGLAASTAYPGEVRRAFATYRPTIVVTFDIAEEAAVYHHPDHEAAGRAATAVANDVGGLTLYLMHTRAPDVVIDYGAVRTEKARAFTVLGSYRDYAPVVGWLNRALRTIGGPRSLSYAGRAVLPSVGISYGELFREVVVPKR